MKLMCVRLIGAYSTRTAEGPIQVMGCDQKGTANDSDQNFPGMGRQQRTCVSTQGDAQDSHCQEKQQDLSPVDLVAGPKGNQSNRRQ